MSEKPTRRPALPPLQITCTSTDCEHEKHCYLATKKLVKADRVGTCRACGARPVDWDRVHARDRADAAYTFRMLRTELIRHHFWHKPIDRKALDHARRKGMRGMKEAAERRIQQSVSAATPARDGRQTPFEGNALYYAQHATATCCRRCIEEWHAIPPGRALAEDEVRYLTELVNLYIQERMPMLTEDGEHVPVVRRPRYRPTASSTHGTADGSNAEADGPAAP
jgi:uncharacterized protein DUF4186